MNWTEAKKQMEQGKQVKQASHRAWYRLGDGEIIRCTVHIHPHIISCSVWQVTKEMREATDWEIAP